MWMMKAPANLSDPTGVLFDEHVVQGFVLVDKQQKRYWLLHNGFTDVTPEEMKGLYSDPESIAIVRHGGIGDLLMITPLAKAIKTRWPQCTVTLLATSPYTDLLQENPNIDTVVKDVLITELCRSYDLYSDVYDLTHSVEFNPESQRKCYYDWTLELYDMEDHHQGPPRPEIYLTDDEKRFAREFYRKNGLLGAKKFVVGMSLTASSPIRAMPPHRIGQLVSLFSKEPDITVVLYGDTMKELPARHRCACGTENFVRPLKGIDGVSSKCVDCGASFQVSFEGIEASWPNVINVACTMDLRKAAATVSHLDLHVSVDTGFLHVAGAFGVKQLLLTSSFDAHCPAGTLPNVSVMQQPYPCAPCFLYKQQCRRAALKGAKGIPCMGSFEPAEVLKRARALLDDPRFRSDRPVYDRDLMVNVKAPEPCPVCKAARHDSDFRCRKGAYSYYVCQGCGCLSLDRAPVLDPAIYSDPVYDATYDLVGGNGVETFASYLLAETYKHLGPKKGVVADLGGRDANFLNGWAADGWQTCAVDFSPSVLKAKEAGKVQKAFQGDLSKLTPAPRKDCADVFEVRDGRLLAWTNGVRVIFLMDVLEHFWDARDLLQKCGQILLPRGGIWIMTPCYDLEERKLSASEWLHANTLFPGEHCTLYTLPALKALGESVGLTLKSLSAMPGASATLALFQKNFITNPSEVEA